MIRLLLPSAAATRSLARVVAGCLRPPAIVTLTGELGTGKTTFVRAALRALGVREVVASPSFTIAQSYRGRGGLHLNHLDLYRLSAGEDVALFAWEDYVEPQAITFVEWPEAAHGVLPSADVSVHLEHRTRLSRLALVEATTQLEDDIAAALERVRPAPERVG